MDSHRQANLEMMLASVADDELIAELRRRKRVRVVVASWYYYPESEERYVDHIKQRVVGLIGNQLLDHVEFLDAPSLAPNTRKLVGTLRVVP